MTAEQVEQTLKLLQRIAETLSGTYTITGAADWPILAALAAVILGLIALMWRDLKATIRDKDDIIRRDLEHEVTERKRQDDLLWSGMRDCKQECMGSRREPR